VFLGVGMTFSLSLFFDADCGDKGKLASASCVTSLSKVTDGDGLYMALEERSDEVIKQNESV
jgi:hypothetical protein